LREGKGSFILSERRGKIERKKPNRQTRAVLQGTLTRRKKKDLESRTSDHGLGENPYPAAMLTKKGRIVKKKHEILVEAGAWKRKSQKDFGNTWKQTPEEKEDAR